MATIYNSETKALNNVNFFATALTEKRNSSAPLTSKDVTMKTLKEWNALADNMIDALWEKFSVAYNGGTFMQGVDANTAVNNAWKPIRSMVGTVGNGARILGFNETVFMTMAVRLKVNKSEEYKNLEKERRGLEKDSARYVEITEQLKGMRESSNGTDYRKDFAQISRTTFKKMLEVYLADCIEQRNVMTIDEIKAERERIKAERKARKARKNQSHTKTPLETK